MPRDRTPPEPPTNMQMPVLSCAVVRFCSWTTHSLFPAGVCGSISPEDSMPGVHARRWHAPRLQVAYAMPIPWKPRGS
mgnify:CR=1 FL=1